MDNAAEKKNQKKKTVNLTAERVIFSIAMILSVVSAAAVLLLTAQKSSQQLTVIASVLFCAFGICSVLSYIKMRADEQKKREKESADMAMAHFVVAHSIPRELFAILSQVFRLFIVSLRLPSHGRWNGLVGVDVLFHIISKRVSPDAIFQALGRDLCFW